MKDLLLHEVFGLKKKDDFAAVLHHHAFDYCSLTSRHTLCVTRLSQLGVIQNPSATYSPHIILKVLQISPSVMSFSTHSISSGIRFSVPLAATFNFSSNSSASR